MKSGTWHTLRASKAGGGIREPSVIPGRVAWVDSHLESRGVARTLRLSTGMTALSIARAVRPAVAWADIVHIHSNGLIAEMGALVANRQRKPVVLTLYGTEIWHYKPRRGIDLFTRAYQRASHVVFYSHGLLTRATELGLGRRDTSVIYPPVAPEFTFHDERAQVDARAALGVKSRHLFVNVKRLHPLAGQQYLIEALGEVISTHPDTRLVICGTGALLADLKAMARASGVEGHVTFTGLLDNATIAQYDAAADAFVLPSLLEACPTVALEALATGTPVISVRQPGRRRAAGAVRLRRVCRSPEAAAGSGACHDPVSRRQAARARGDLRDHRARVSSAGRAGAVQGDLRACGRVDAGHVRWSDSWHLNWGRDKFQFLHSMRLVSVARTETYPDPDSRQSSFVRNQE